MPKKKSDNSKLLHDELVFLLVLAVFTVSFSLVTFGYRFSSELSEATQLLDASNQLPDINFQLTANTLSILSLFDATPKIEETTSRLVYIKHQVGVNYAPTLGLFDASNQISHIRDQSSNVSGRISRALTLFDASNSVYEVANKFEDTKTALTLSLNLFDASKQIAELKNNDLNIKTKFAEAFKLFDASKQMEDQGRVAGAVINRIILEKQEK